MKFQYEVKYTANGEVLYKTVAANCFLTAVGSFMERTIVYDDIISVVRHFKITEEDR